MKNTIFILLSALLYAQFTFAEDDISLQQDSCMIEDEELKINDSIRYAKAYCYIVSEMKKANKALVSPYITDVDWYTWLNAFHVNDTNLLKWASDNFNSKGYEFKSSYKSNNLRRWLKTNRKSGKLIMFFSRMEHDMILVEVMPLLKQDNEPMLMREDYISTQSTGFLFVFDEKNAISVYYRNMLYN